MYCTYQFSRRAFFKARVRKPGEILCIVTDSGVIHMPREKGFCRAFHDPVSRVYVYHEDANGNVNLGADLRWPTPS